MGRLDGQEGGSTHSSEGNKTGRPGVVRYGCWNSVSVRCAGRKRSVGYLGSKESGTRIEARRHDQTCRRAVIGRLRGSVWFMSAAPAVPGVPAPC